MEQRFSAALSDERTGGFSRWGRSFHLLGNKALTLIGLGAQGVRSMSEMAILRQMIRHFSSAVLHNGGQCRILCENA